MNRFSIALAALCCCGISINTLAQQVDYPDSFNEPIKLFDSAMGDFHFPISSDNEMAQSYFDQGFQLMYSFAKEDSARSFKASHTADPDCAISIGERHGVGALT